MITLLFSATLFGQTFLHQDRNAIRSAWPQYRWTMFEYGEAHTLANVPVDSFIVGDVFVSSPFLTMPWMTLELVVTDTGVMDSVRFRGELWQSSNEDSATFQFVKSLIFHHWKRDSVSVGDAVVDTTGRFWCSFGEGDIFTGLDYSIVKLRALEGHKQKIGVGLVGRFKGEILTR